MLSKVAMSLRADPPFEPAARARAVPTDSEMLAAARTAFTRFRHHDVAGSLADLDDALYGRKKKHR